MTNYISGILATVTALALIGAVTYLASSHIIDGQATIAFFSTLIGGAGGGGIAIVAHKNARSGG